MKQIQIYVKPNSNCEGLSLITVEALSKVWRGEFVKIPFGPERKSRKVVGWCSLFGGSPCPVNVAKVMDGNGDVGFVIIGDDWGVRVLDGKAPITNEHLPRGYGMPIITIEDEADLPREIMEAM